MGFWVCKPSTMTLELDLSNWEHHIGYSRPERLIYLIIILLLGNNLHAALMPEFDNALIAVWTWSGYFTIRFFHHFPCQLKIFGFAFKFWLLWPILNAISYCKHTNNDHVKDLLKFKADQVLSTSMRSGCKGVISNMGNFQQISW